MLILLIIFFIFIAFPIGAIAITIVSMKKEGKPLKKIVLRSVLELSFFIIFYAICIFMYVSSLKEIGNRNTLYEKEYSNIAFEGDILSICEHHNPLGREYYVFCVKLNKTNTTFFRRDGDISKGFGLRIHDSLAIFTLEKNFNVNNDSLMQSTYVLVNEQYDGQGVFLNQNGGKIIMPIDYIADCKMDDFYDCE